MSDKRMEKARGILTFPHYIRVPKNVSGWQCFIFWHWKRPLFSLSFEFNCHMHLYYVAGFCVASVLPYVFTTILKHEVFAFNADLYAIDNCLCNSLQNCSKSSIEVLSKQISAVTAKTIWKKFTKFRKESGNPASC